MSIENLYKNSVSLQEIENSLRTNKNLLPEIINYVSKSIIPYTVTDYSEHIQNMDDENQFDEMRHLFIGEGIQIFQNLWTVFQVYIQKNPQKFVNLDISISWYESADPIVPRCKDNKLEYIPNPFANKPLFSTMLSILTKLAEHIGSVYSNNLSLLDRRIEYIERLIKEKDAMTALVYQNILEKVKKNREHEIKQYQQFVALCAPLRDYYYALLGQTAYCHYLPASVLDIFLVFQDIAMDDAFLIFFLRFDDFLSSEFRSKYLPKVITLLSDKEANFSTKSILKTFQPKMDLFIMDIITLYKKYLKDPSLLQDIFFIVSVCARCFKKNRYQIHSLCTQQHINFVSICVTLISKLDEIKKDLPDENTYSLLVGDAIQCILEVIQENKNVLDSYLEYQLTNCIIELVKKEELVQKYSSILVQLFDSVLETKLSVIYMANTLSDTGLDGLLTSFITPCKLQKVKQWSTIYKNIQDPDDSIVDPLTSCVVVKPCFIPIDTQGTMTQVCDLYMLCTYLWSKPENPFTRQPLSIEDVLEFNQKDDIIEANKNVVKELKKAIEKAKL
jgi:hypothetical protein